MSSRVNSRILYAAIWVPLLVCGLLGGLLLSGAPAPDGRRT